MVVGKLVVNDTGSVAALLGFFEVEQHIIPVVMTVVDIPEDREVDINRLVEGGGSRVWTSAKSDSLQVALGSMVAWLWLMVIFIFCFLVLVVVVFRVSDARPPWLIS